MKTKIENYLKNKNASLIDINEEARSFRYLKDGQEITGFYENVERWLLHKGTNILTKTEEAIQKKFAQGMFPDYETKRGRLLWIDGSHYDSYSNITHSKILRDVFGKFWGYSDDSRAKKIH